MDYVEFLNKAAQDKDYRARIRANPEQVVEEAGAALDGAKVKVVENTATTYHIALPSNPNIALEDEVLENTSGGLVAGDGGCMRSGNRGWGGSVAMCFSCVDPAKAVPIWQTRS